MLLINTAFKTMPYFKFLGTYKQDKSTFWGDFIKQSVHFNFPVGFLFPHTVMQEIE